MGIILGAVYMLHMLAKVVWGPLKTPVLHGEHGESHATPGDIGAREIAILVPLAVAVVWLGVYPGPLLRSLRGPVSKLDAPLVYRSTEASAR